MTARLLMFLINNIFKQGQIPDTFKTGVVTPIYKGKGKPVNNPNSYRKITVTSTISKIIEKLLLIRCEDQILQHQSQLQRGFTKGVSQTSAALILTEIIAEANDSNSPLYLGFLDAQKAFDKVWHQSMLRKVYLAGIEGNQWTIISEMYRDLNSRVKWDNVLSSSFEEKQGVRQGGVLSPTCYKMFINPLLRTYETHHLGCHIGTIYCGTPTVADDITLASFDQYELQTMLNIQGDYATSEKYQISESKSQILHIKEAVIDTKHTLNGTAIPSSASATHLGITRDNYSKHNTGTVAQDRISTSRKALYAMMGSGLHGANGLNPQVSLHLIRVYVLPRLIYGLDVIRMTAKDTALLTAYHKKLLKQIQHLPDRASDAASYLLLGEAPLEAEIHKRTLTMFGAVCRDYESVPNQLAWRQLATKKKTSHSWFIHVATLLHKYGLPNPHDLLESPPGKHAWKNTVYRAIDSHWEKHLKTNAKTKPTLKYVNIDQLKVGKIHRNWESAGCEKMTVTKAAIKCRLLTGSLILQSTKHRFNQHEVDPTCILCHNGPETRRHFLLECPALQEARSPFIQAMRTNQEMHTLLPWNNAEQLMAAILDSENTKLTSPGKDNLENIARGMCYRLYVTRSHMLKDISTSNRL